MKTLPVDLTRHLRSEYHTLTFLFDLALKSAHTYYWTTFNDNIRYGSVWYEAKGLNFEAIQSSLAQKADSISLEINNVDNKFSDLVLANEIRGKQVTIKEAAIDKNNAVVDVVTVFVGFVDAMEINQRVATVEVYNHMIQWKKMTPRRIHSATCPWQFKDGTYCTYAGAETWCDQSWDRCDDLANTNDFGGFRWLPSIVGKDIMWGRAPAKVGTK